MRRLPITLVLTALTGLALGTAAIAAPDGIGIGDCPMADDLAMAAMHADADARLAMHEACPMSDGVMPHDGAMPHGDHAHHGGAGHGHESGAHDDTLHDRHHR